MDRSKQLFLRILAPIFILVLFILTWALFRYISVDDSSSYSRLTMHEFYAQDNIDVLFMGASHVVQGVDPDVADRVLGCNTFNLATLSQPMDVTCLLIKEAVERYQVQQIFVDLSYHRATIPFFGGVYMLSIYLVTDYLQPSPRNIFYLMNRSESEDLANSFLIARRNPQSLFDLQHMIDVFHKKQSTPYLKYQYISHQFEDFAGKGFVQNNVTVPDGGFVDTDEIGYFDLQAIQEQWVSSVREIIRYCREKGVNLTFISVPVSDYLLLCYEDYDDYIAFVKQLLTEDGNEIEYIDFNLMRPEYWPGTSTLFSDSSHLNGGGARLFSDILCRYFNGEIPAEDLFYPSVREKLEHLSPGFYGIETSPVPPDGQFLDCRMIVHSPAAFESRVFLPGEGGETVLKMHSDSLTFRIPVSYHGDCCVELLFCDGTKREYSLNF